MYSKMQWQSPLYTPHMYSYRCIDYYKEYPSIRGNCKTLKTPLSPSLLAKVGEKAISVLSYPDWIVF